MSSGQEHAHEITSPGRPETVEVADGVYAYVHLTHLSRAFGHLRLIFTLLRTS